MMSENTGKLEIKTSFMPFPPWLQALMSPVIEIDGIRHKKYWGTHTFEVTPGKHVIRAWHGWFFFSQCHLSKHTVRVSEGAMEQLTWSTPARVMAPGKWKRNSGSGNREQGDRKEEESRE